MDSPLVYGIDLTVRRDTDRHNVQDLKVLYNKTGENTTVFLRPAMRLSAASGDYLLYALKNLYYNMDQRSGS